MKSPDWLRFGAAAMCAVVVLATSNCSMPVDSGEDDRVGEEGLLDPAGIEDFEDGGSESANGLAEFATIVDPTSIRAADLNDLTVGDRVRFQLPTPSPSSPVRQVIQITCVCRWSVVPETFGGFEPPETCTTVFAVDESGDARIAVEQICDGEPFASFNQDVVAATLPAGIIDFDTPTADAGSDTTVDEHDTVVLDGTQSFDPNELTLTYRWEQIEGPTVTLTAPLSRTPIFVAPNVSGATTLRFKLAVDNGQFSDEDEVAVSVLDVGSGAGSVFADAGPSRAVSEGDVVFLDGSGSTGTGVGELSFSWDQTSGPTAVLDNPSGSMVSFIAPEVGPDGAALLFDLTVSDATVSDTDTVNVTVFDADPFLFDPAQIEDDEGDDAGGDDGNVNNNGDVVSNGNANENANDNSGGLDDGNANDNSGGVVNAGPVTFRGVYGGSSTGEMLGAGGPVDQLLADGIQHFGIKLNSLRVPIGGGDQLRLRLWSEKLNAQGAKLWVFFNYFAVLEYQWLLPLDDPYVGPDGVTVALKPCPQSQSFWDSAITSRFVAMAELTDPDNQAYIPALADALAAVMLDPELYGQALHNYRDPCYCQSCFMGFFAQQNISDAVPQPAQRVAYLQNNNLVAAYDVFERDGVRDRARACREAFRAVNPNLEIGGTNIVRFDRSPFYPGLGLGFGTADQPAYDWSQGTFTLGFTEAVPAREQQQLAAGMNVIHTGGLWMEMFTPGALGDHYYTMASRSGGAWLYLSNNYGLAVGDLCHPLSEYRQRLKEATDELLALEADAGHVSSFAGAPFVQGCLESTSYDVPGNVVSLEAGPAAAEGPLIRREAGYFFRATAGESISIDIEFVEFGSSDTGNGYWFLMSPSGVVMESAPLAEEINPGRVRVTATETGLYKLACNTSFVHGFRLLNASHAGAYRVVLGNQRIALFRPNLLSPEPQFFIYVPAGVTQVGLHLSASAAEPIEIVIQDERDRTTPLFSERVASVFEPTLTLSSNPAGVVLEVITRNPLGGGAEDFNIAISSGAMPYLSRTRSGLLVPGP